MACKNFRESYISKASSGEISWQGDVVSELDICIGDSLTYIGNVILSKIKDLLKGKGIVLEDLDLDDCEYISDILDQEEKNLLNVLDTYKKAICELRDDNDVNATNLAAFAEVSLYTLGCLQLEGNECDGDISFKVLIQTIIDKVCQLNTQYQGIASTILDTIEEGAGNFLLGGAIKSCGNNGISKSGSGATAVLQFEALVPPNCPILYTGSTSNFDNTGKGLASTPYCGWYLCNGQNNTPNSTNLPQNQAANLKYIIRFT